MNELGFQSIKERYDQLDLDSCSNSTSEGWIFDAVLNLVKPKNILEIGFYRGGSAFLMMRLSEAFLTSIDPIYNETDDQLGRSAEDKYKIHAKEFECVEKIKDEFGGRFTFIQKRSDDKLPEIENKKFDLMFCDGEHREDGPRTDFNLALKLKIPFILADDWVQPQNYPKTTPTIWREEFSDKLKPMASFYREAFYNGSPIPMVLLKNMMI